MKKIVVLSFLVFSIISYSEVKEVVKNSEGENILLMKDQTWQVEAKSESAKEFEENVVLSNLEMSAKRSNGRSLTGTITNNSRNKLEYVTYKIRWNIDGDYSTLKEFTIRDLGYRESKDFNHRIKLEGISGRDYKVEVESFEFSK
jgi:hypothetical protein